MKIFGSPGERFRWREHEGRDQCAVAGLTVPEALAPPFLYTAKPANVFLADQR
jgi:hypothetical protein